MGADRCWRHPRVFGRPGPWTPAFSEPWSMLSGTAGASEGSAGRTPLARFSQESAGRRVRGAPAPGSLGRAGGGLCSRPRCGCSGDARARHPEAPPGALSPGGGGRGARTAVECERAPPARREVAGAPSGAARPPLAAPLTCQSGACGLRGSPTWGGGGGGSGDLEGLPAPEEGACGAALPPLPGAPCPHPAAAAFPSANSENVGRL